MIFHLAHSVLVTSPQVGGSEVGTAQVMTFAVILGTFMTLVVLLLFWLRSGHEHSRRTVLVRQQRERELARERARILEAHEPPARHGEELPR